MKKISLNIDGMICESCEKRIEGTLLILNGVESAVASMKKSTVEITYDEGKVDKVILMKAIEEIGYEVLIKPKNTLRTVVPLFMLLFAGFYIIKSTIGFNFIPQVTDGMGYGLIFLIGLLTSIHCIAMCGGLALSQSVSHKRHNKSFTPSILYNIGRVISYTVIGGIVGGLGGLISPSGQFKGIVAVFAGVFMFLLGLKMLNIIHLPSWVKFKLPKLPFRTNNKSNSVTPLFVGLLNGFMPCGPLQTMQLYALGTGSVVKGGLSMFFFSVGTVPLMFGFGAITSLISSKLGKRIMKLSAILVMVLGIIMTGRGLALSGISLNVGEVEKVAGVSDEINVEEGKQIVNLTIESYQYIPDVKVVKVGVPVKINLKVSSINGCNNPITIPQYGIEKNLTSEDTTIEFTPDKEGPITITCWMGMITTKITAVAEPSNVDTENPNSYESNTAPASGAGCSVQGESKAALATIKDNEQIIEMSIGSYGYSPNIHVVQAGVPVTWVINGEEINYCNYQLAIPDAGFVHEISEGSNEIKFEPSSPGEILFTCGMNMLNGKIVIVENPSKVDLKALEEAEKPDPGQQGGCCDTL